MNRIGFDINKHPFQLQLRICLFSDLQGIQTKDSVTLNFQEGTITNYHTDKNQVNTTINEYTASDDELKELYGFFTLDAIEKFEALPENELRQYYIGYYDWASLRYLLISKDGQVRDGVRYSIYSNDPIELAIKWMSEVSPFDLDI